MNFGEIYYIIYTYVFKKIILYHNVYDIYLIIFEKCTHLFMRAEVSPKTIKHMAAGTKLVVQ